MTGTPWRVAATRLVTSQSTVPGPGFSHAGIPVVAGWLAHVTPFSVQATRHPEDLQQPVR